MSTKPLINISIIGHVDSGKSTLCGQLASRLGAFNAREQEKLAKIAAENQKSSFSLAYFTDRTEQERQRGVTINTTLVEMQTKKFRINFLDCPGHADYIKNATSGCKQSDLSVVVVPADFQASVSADGTLKTHLTLSAILGSKNFIVCINKLDEVAEKNKTNLATTFDAAVASVGQLLKKLAVKLEDVIFLPISALHGTGVFKDSPRFDFFQGAKAPKTKDEDNVRLFSLEEAIDFQEPPVRQTDKPLRIPVSNVAHVPGQGVIVCGRVDYGIIKKDDKIKILPVGLNAIVKNVQAHRQDVEAGEAGMNIGFSLIVAKDQQPLLNKVAAGDMVGPQNDDAFQLYPFYRIMCVSLKGKSKSGAEEKGIRAGYTPVISCGTINVATKIVKLVGILDKTNKISIENPEVVTKDQRFIGIIYPTKQALFESHSVYPSLGKFVFRDSGVLVGVGNIAECLTEEAAKNTYGININEVKGIAAAKKVGKK